MEPHYAWVAKFNMNFSYRCLLSTHRASDATAGVMSGSIDVYINTYKLSNFCCQHFENTVQKWTWKLQHTQGLKRVNSEEFASSFQINLVFVLHLNFIDKNCVYSHCLVIYEIWPMRHSIMKTKSPIDESLISFSASQIEVTLFAVFAWTNIVIYCSLIW